MYRVNLGRYVSSNSWLHKIDPRIKLLMNILFLVAVFTAKNLILLGILDVIATIAYLTTKVSFWYPLRLMKLIIPLFAFVFVIEAWMIPAEGRIYFESSNFKISTGTFFMAGKVAQRLYASLLITAMFTLSTKPMEVTRAIEDLLSPLKLVKFPVHIIGMVISIALNFTPTMIDQAKKISDAQASRGMDIRNSSWMQKIRNVKIIWIPMLSATFIHAIELGNALDARGYDPYLKRIKYTQYKVSVIDILWLILIITIVVTIFVIKFNIVLPSWWI